MGKVYSFEIIPEIAQMAQSSIAESKVENVEIIEGDLNEGYPEKSPFDRVIFTASVYDIPSVFHGQVKIGGYLLTVIKVEVGTDQMVLLEKKKDYFESTFSKLCAFVSVTGKNVFYSDNPTTLFSHPLWDEFKDNEVDRSNFWWGDDRHIFHMRSFAFRSFLRIVEPSFHLFRYQDDDIDPTNWFFGLLDDDLKSLVLAQKNHLVSYGNLKAKEKLMNCLHLWVDLGMPSISSLNLRIYPIQVKIKKQSQQWVVKKNSSQFLWSLKDDKDNSKND